jgi:hypothetical protein
LFFEIDALKSLLILRKTKKKPNPCLCSKGDDSKTERSKSSKTKKPIPNAYALTGDDGEKPKKPIILMPMP